MAILKHIRRIKFIDLLIRKRATGDLETLAQKNNLCRSAMAGVLQEMRALGFPIKYDKANNTYYYKEEGEMVTNLFVQNGKILSRDELGKIGNIQDLCFSELTVYKLCKNEKS